MELEEVSVCNEKEPAVTIRNAYKKYGSKTIVLDGLNMTVPERSIYGLLGPSGSGKTTLLKCILGRIPLDSGEILVKVKTLAQVGYMPQDITLYKELTILESTTFYGRIFGLSYSEIEKRTDEWLEFLELPNRFRIVGELSGGQQRRVSFAVALLHNPPLLILDEPTAGVDPILSEKLWDKFVHMVENENKTIIITTHYIEEARRAHIIGIMRNGKLLVEESPTQIMTRFNSSSIEDIFLHLSQKQQQQQQSQQSTSHFDEIHDVPVQDASRTNDNLTTNTTPKSKPAKMPLQQSLKCSRAVVLALMTKTLYWMKGNKLIMFFVLVQPIFNSAIFNLSIGENPVGLNIAVINEELPDISRCQSMPLTGCNFTQPLSCRYLNKLQQKTYKLTTYKNIKEGKIAVKKNKAWGMLYFAKSYTASINDRIMLGRNISDATLQLSDVQIWLDMSNLHIGYLLKRDAISACLEFLRELFSDCGWPSAVADLPIQTKKAIHGDNNYSWRKSVMTALVVALQYYLPMIFTLESILMERKTGSLDRTIVSGVTILEIAVSHMIVQFVTLTIQSTSIMVIEYVIYDNPLLVHNLPEIILILFVSGACSMFFAFLLAVLCNEEKLPFFLAVGSSYGVMIFCGLLWPIEAMHWLVKPIADILPVAPTRDAIQSLAIRDWDITHTTVYKGIVSNVAWSCVVILLTLIILKKREGFAIK